MYHASLNEQGFIVCERSTVFQIPKALLGILDWRGYKLRTEVWTRDTGLKPVVDLSMGLIGKERM